MNKAANNRFQRIPHPRHASCVRTCRAGVRNPLNRDVRRRTFRLLNMQIQASDGSMTQGSTS